MTDTLINIPGPAFLFYFISLSVFLTLIAKFLIHLDASKNFPMPEPTQLTPLEISVLSGGPTEAARLTILNLIKKEILGVDGKGIFTKIIRIIFIGKRR